MLDIESDLFVDFGNISNYHSINRPQNSHFSICLPTEYQLRELISVMSSEWLEETELSSDMIRLDTPSITIGCAYDSDRFDALYNPVKILLLITCLECILRVHRKPPSMIHPGTTCST